MENASLKIGDEEYKMTAYTGNRLPAKINKIYTK